MYKKTKHKRRRIALRKFMEEIVIPLAFTILILYAIFILLVMLGLRFNSLTELIIYVGVVLFLVFGIVHEISKRIMKKFFRK